MYFCALEDVVRHSANDISHMKKSNSSIHRSSYEKMSADPFRDSYSIDSYCINLCFFLLIVG